MAFVKVMDSDKVYQAIKTTGKYYTCEIRKMVLGAKHNIFVYNNKTEAVGRACSCFNLVPQTLVTTQGRPYCL